MGQRLAVLANTTQNALLRTEGLCQIQQMSGGGLFLFTHLKQKTHRNPQRHNVTFGLLTVNFLLDLCPVTSNYAIHSTQSDSSIFLKKKKNIPR